MEPIHQGVVIEVRPGFERDGVRSVRLRVRSARWERIERRAHPGTNTAEIEVPVWKRFEDTLLIDRTVTEIIGDEDAVLVGVPVPGDATRTFAVKIEVTKAGE